MGQEQEPRASLSKQAQQPPAEELGQEKQPDEATLQQELKELDHMLKEGPFASLYPAPQEIPSAPAALQRLESFLLLREESQAAQAKKAPVTAQPEGMWASFQRWLKSSRRWAGPAIGAAAILVVLPFVLPTTPQITPPQPRKPATRPPIDRTFVAKGQIPLVVSMLHAAPAKATAKGHSEPELAAQRQVLHPGDFVQFRYSTPKLLHVMIVSLNRKGEIFAFLPFQGDHSIQVRPGQKQTWPAGGSYELDEYLGWERFFVVASTRPFLFATLKKTLTKAYKRASRDVERMGPVTGPWQAFTMLIKKTQRTPAQHRPK